MNGWIETKNPNVFADVGNDDIVLRTSTIGNKVVIGNGSKLAAAAYVSNNCIGVRRVPEINVALDVAGRLRAMNDTGCTMDFDATGMSVNFPTSNLFHIQGDSMSLTSLSSSSVFMPSTMSYEGIVSAENVIGNNIFKVGKRFLDAHVVRVFHDAVDLTGIHEDDFTRGDRVSIQGAVLFVESCERFGNSCVHLSVRSSTSSNVKARIGDAELFALDASAMDLNRFGGLVSKSIERTMQAVTISAALVVLDDGRENLVIRFKTHGDHWRASEWPEGSTVSIFTSGAELVNVLSVRKREVMHDHHSVELCHIDNVTRISDVYPALLLALVGRTAVTFGITAISREVVTVKLQGPQVSFQANKLVLAGGSVRDELGLGVTEVPSGAIVEARVEWCDSGDQSGDSETTVVRPKAARIINQSVILDFARLGRTTMASGVAHQVEVALAGRPWRVMDASYSQNSVSLTVSCRTRPRRSGTLCTLCGLGPATLWRVTDCLRIGHADDEFSLTVEFANASDYSQHVPYVAGDVVYAMEFGPEVSDVVSSHNALELAVAGGVVIGTHDASRAKLTVGGGGNIMIADGGSLILEGGGGVVSRYDSFHLSSPSIFMDAENVAFKGSITANDYGITERGVSFQKTCVASDGYYLAVCKIDVNADPLRIFSSGYNYKVGDFISFIDLPVSPPKHADCAFIKGVRYDILHGFDSPHFHVAQTTRLFISMATSPKLFDCSGAFSVEFCRSVCTSPIESPEARSEFSFRATASTTLKDSATLRVLVEAVGGKQMIKHVDTLFCINSERSLPKNAFLLSACEPVASGLFYLELELLAGRPGIHGWVDLLVTGSQFTLQAIEAPFHVSTRERVSSVALRSQVLTLLPGLSTSCLNFQGTESRHVASLTIPSASCTFQCDHAEKTHGDGSIDLFMTDFPPRLVVTAQTVEVRVTLRGAPTVLVSVRPIGLDACTLSVRIPDRARLSLERMRGYDAIFVLGTPWRVSSIGSPISGDAYVIELVLHRLCEPADFDLFDAQPGQALHLLPCKALASNVVRSDVIETHSVVVNGYEIKSNDNHLVIEDSLAVSKRDTYARFLKNVSVQGNLVAETISHVSDRAFKRDIQTRSPQADLAAIKQLGVYDYSFLDRTSKRVEFGVLADELETLIPGAVQEVQGFVANVYASATYNSTCLIIDGLFKDILTENALVQLSAINDGLWREVKVLSAFENSSKTFVTLSDPTLANQDYFVYGTWAPYKVANTTQLLMACLNAIKAMNE